MIRAAGLALALLMPGSALAQAYQCRAPAILDAPTAIRPDGPTRRVAIGGHTLAASWSPEYCRSARDAASFQCSGRDGRFGFVLHGLWPEARRGPYPQWCATTLPDAATIRANLCMTPSARLIAHEWAKHGSCMARRPQAYFATAGRLWRAVAWPDADRLARRPGLTAGTLRAAFVEANPGWRPAQVGLLVSRTGWLQEIRLCYDSRLRPRDCPRAQRGPADAAPLKIWRGL